MRTHMYACIYSSQAHIFSPRDWILGQIHKLSQTSTVVIHVCVKWDWAESQHFTCHEFLTLPRAPHTVWSDLWWSLVALIAFIGPGLCSLYSTHRTYQWVFSAFLHGLECTFQQPNSFFYVFHAPKADWFWLQRCSHSKNIHLSHACARDTEWLFQQFRKLLLGKSKNYDIKPQGGFKKISSCWAIIYFFLFFLPSRF